VREIRNRISAGPTGACEHWSIGLFSDFDRFDHHGFDWNIAMSILVGRRDNFDGFDDLGPRGDFAENAVADAILGLGFIEEVVVVDVDEELTRGAVGNRGSGHSDGVLLIAQPIGGLVDDRWVGAFLLHVWRESAPLDHEV